MNNIFLPNDPLLYNSANTDYRLLYEQKLIKDREAFELQYADYMKNLSKTLPEDKLNLLNSSIKNLSQELREKLQNNSEFVLLNKELQETVQDELVQLVKNSINSNSSMITNIDKQIQIINNLDNEAKEEDRKNISEINDYIKNYSNMTFADYKKLKNVGNE